MKIVTFYNSKIDSSILEYQQRVFKHFGFTIEQVMPKKWGTHGSAIDEYLTEKGDNWESLVLFDVDSIPLTKTVIPESVSWAKKNGGICGIAQKANHIKDSIIYVGPAFLVITRDTYVAIGRPTFCGTSRADNGGELTYECIKHNRPVKFIFPTHVKDPKWDLDRTRKFGIGTTYENKIFHNFEARKGRNDGFIDRCKKAIGER